MHATISPLLTKVNVSSSSSLHLEIFVAYTPGTFCLNIPSCSLSARFFQNDNFKLSNSK